METSGYAHHGESPGTSLSPRAPCTFTLSGRSLELALGSRLLCLAKVATTTCIRILDLVFSMERHVALTIPFVCVIVVFFFFYFAMQTISGYFSMT